MNLLKINRLPVLLVITYLCLLAGMVYGQKNEFEPIKFDRLTSENIKLVKGLSQNWIYTIHQDKYGYMWFGTWDGLNKYDGYNFTIYNEKDGLTDHAILCMLEDENGTFWIGTDKGFNKFDRRHQTFKQFPELPGDSTSLYHNRVMSLIESRDGSIWLGTGGGLLKFDKVKEAFTSFLSTSQPYYSPRSNYILNLCEDDKGIIWISTSYGLVKFNPITERSTRYYHIEGDTTSLSNNNVRYVMQEKSGNFWIGTRNGLNYFDTTSQKLKHYYANPNNPYSISDNKIQVIYQDHEGEIWVGTENGGLNYFDKVHNRFFHYENVLNDKASLSNDKIYSIYEDRSGNLWVGTYNGVNKINKYYNDFGHRLRTSDDNSSLNTNIIWSFDKDRDDKLWIATSKGINVLDLKSSKYFYLSNEPGKENSLAGNDVRTLLYSPAYDCFWFGFFGSGFDKYNVKSKTFTHFTFDPNKNSVSNDYINDILLADDGKLWLATGNGLDRFDPATNKFVVFYNDKKNPKSLGNDITICLLEDRKKTLWIGTDNGLNKYNESDNTFTNFNFNEGSNENKSANSIFYLSEDHSGIIWVGTSGGGLIKFNPDSGHYKIYTTNDGLPNNVIYSILEDQDGNLWLSTNLGLSKFYVSSERFVNYDVKDGIQSNEFNLGACYKDQNGEMYFGGMNGYNVFNPVNIKYNPNMPVITISAFRKFNEKLSEEYFAGDTIHLRYDDNFFSFEISSLDYTNPSKNKYRYKLNNFDKDWIQTDANNRLAEYKKVPPGYYTFMANGTNNDGVWNDKGIALTVIITAPWWTTWWFSVLLVLALIIVLWVIIYRRIKRIRRKSEVDAKVLEIEKQKFDLEQKALRLQMNPHFIFNSLNSIQSYILSHDTDKAVMYLGKFSQLMRLILTNSGYKFIPVKEELKTITYYLDLEKLRFDNKFDYSITIDKNIDVEFVEIPPMIIQPYIENAIIHGLLHKPSKGQIDIDFRLDNETIVCSVVDNGVGREKSMTIEKATGIKRKSKGMMITKARLEILSRQSNDEFSIQIIDLKDEFGNAKGTKVEIRIHFKEE